MVYEKVVWGVSQLFGLDIHEIAEILLLPATTPPYNLLAVLKSSLCAERATSSPASKGCSTGLDRRNVQKTVIGHNSAEVPGLPAGCVLWDGVDEPLPSCADWQRRLWLRPLGSQD